MTTTMTSKGQVTIPKLVRERLGLTQGSRVEFNLDDRGEVVIRRAETGRPPSRFEAARGLLGKSDLTTDEIMALLRD